MPHTFIQSNGLETAFVDFITSTQNADALSGSE